MIAHDHFCTYYMAHCQNVGSPIIGKVTLYLKPALFAYCMALPDFMSMKRLVNCRFCGNSTSAWQLQTNAISPECISSHAQDHAEVQLEEYFSSQIRRALVLFVGAALHTEPAQIYSFRGFTTTRRTQAPPRSRG